MSLLVHARNISSSAVAIFAKPSIKNVTKIQKLHLVISNLIFSIVVTYIFYTNIHTYIYIFIYKISHNIAKLKIPIFHKFQYLA